MNAPLPASATSPGSHSVLPDAWIEKLFQKFEDYYGAKWAAQYGSFPRERVKRTWSEELAGFAAKPECVASALSAQKSNPFPPTLPEFLGLCREALRRIGDDVKPMLAHKPTADDRAKVLAMINKAANSITGRDEYDPLLWARKPKSQKAMDMVIDGAKKSERLRAVLEELRETGVVSEVGKLLKRYKGSGQWVTA